MTWWQMLLLIAAAIGAGILVGVIIYLISKGFSRRRVTATPKKADQASVDRSVVRRKPQKPATLTPLLSGRSFKWLSAGLIVGILIAFGYWLVIPLINSTLSNMSQGAVLPFAEAPKEGLHESIVIVQMVNPGAEYVDIKTLQHQGQYYAAKANTMPFFEFLSETLASDMPQYSYTAQELSQMTRIRYNWDSDIPSIEIKFTGNSDVETAELTPFIPITFREYLVVEEDNNRIANYNATKDSIAVTESLLMAAQQKLGDIELRVTQQNLTNNPEYLQLNAEIVALNLKLSEQAAVLAAFTASGDNTSQMYLQNVAIFERTSIALAEAQKDLGILTTTVTVAHLTENLEYQTTKGEVSNLSAELARLNSELVTLSDVNAARARVVDSLVVGNPTLPVAVPPDRMRARNAITMGAIIGLVAAWLFLNFGWVKNKVFSIGTAGSSADEVEEAEPEATEKTKDKNRAPETSGVGRGRSKSPWDD